MQLDWRDAVYAVCGPLFVFVLGFLLGRRRSYGLGRQQSYGSWFWSPGEIRLMGSAGAALILGPVAAGIIGAVQARVSGAGLWAGAAAPLLLSFTFSLAAGIAVILSGRSPQRVPLAVHRFLARWERQGRGAVPQVQMVRTPPMVRLQFPDATAMGAEALEALQQLQQELASSHALVAWSGDQRVFPAG